MPRTPLEAYERRVIKTQSGCWGWSLKVGNHGYGVFSFGGKKMMAHRFSYEMHVGYIPDGLCVLHKCDNKSCSNPKHLFLGTLEDNNKDMWSKGRGKTWKTPSGEKCPTSKLRDAQVRKIKANSSDLTRVALAAMYGVSLSCIKSIRSGKTWRHIR